MFECRKEKLRTYKYVERLEDGDILYWFALYWYLILLFDILNNCSLCTAIARITRKIQSSTNSNRNESIDFFIIDILTGFSCKFNGNTLNGSHYSNNPYFLVSNKGKPLQVLNGIVYKKSKKLKWRRIEYVKQMNMYCEH